MTAAHDCPRTAELLAAGRRGALPGPLAEHAESCGACSDALAADRALAGLGAALDHMASLSLPNPAQILFRAQIRKTRAAAERATLPLRVWGYTVGIGCAAGAVGVGLAHRQALTHLLLAAPSQVAAGGSPLLLVAGVIGIGLASLVLYLHSAWSEG
jgi:hypothetical protein